MRMGSRLLGDAGEDWEPIEPPELLFAAKAWVQALGRECGADAENEARQQSSGNAQCPARRARPRRNISLGLYAQTRVGAGSQGLERRERRPDRGRIARP